MFWSAPPRAWAARDEVLLKRPQLGKGTILAKMIARILVTGPPEVSEYVGYLWN